MYQEFRNESWIAAEEKDFFIRTLKSIRFHKPLERLDSPTTTLLFVSGLTDPSIRQHFEDSSRHFKTYNVYTDVADFFSHSTRVFTKQISWGPEWVFSFLEFLLRFKFLAKFLSPFLTLSQSSHLAYRKKMRSLSLDDVVEEISILYQTIGLTNFSKLNVIIGANENRNVHYGIKFLAKSLNDVKVRKLLENKGIIIPDGCQICYGIFHKKRGRLAYENAGSALEINKSLLEYLEKKTAWVMERVRVKDLARRTAQPKRTLIIGRRILTRGQDVLNENSLLQSYDYEQDLDLKFIQKMLKNFLRAFKNINARALVVIENRPNEISCLISKDPELQKLLNGKEIALACVEPDTKDIYTFEGDQFIQKSLRQVF